MVESLHRKRRLLLAFAALTAVVIAAIFASQRIGAANASSEQPSYPALSTGAPSGLRLISAYHAPQSGEPDGPAYPADPPAPDWAVPSTIRKITVSASGVSLWIGSTAEGGVCVLIHIEGNAGMGQSCSTPGGLASGASSELTTASGEIVLAGVAPSGVSSIEETMPDGSTATIPVSDDGWAYIYRQPTVAASTAKLHHPRARKGRR